MVFNVGHLKAEQFAHPKPRRVEQHDGYAVHGRLHWWARLIAHHIGCVIRTMSVHDFSACRSGISRHAGQGFQAMSVHRFMACRSSS